MITKNNWVQTNIDEYCEKNVDFVCTLVPRKFKKKSFQVAADQTAQKIYRDIKKPLYILLSGGADSEFIVRLFHRLKIPFTAVIVDTGLNPFESKVAHLVCEQLDIKPHIIETNEEKLLDFFLNIMFKYNKGRSMYSIPALVALEYTNSVGGVGITGATPVDDVNIQDVFIVDHEFYPDRFGYEYIGFFYYDIEIFYATLAAIKDIKTVPEFKNQTYGTVQRKKSKLNFTDRTQDISMRVSRRTSNQAYYNLGNVEEVLEYLKKWSK